MPDIVKKSCTAVKEEVIRLANVAIIVKEETNIQKSYEWFKDYNKGIWFPNFRLS